MEKFLEKFEKEVKNIIENYTEDKLDELYKKVVIVNYLQNSEAQKIQLELFDSIRKQDLSKIDFNDFFRAMNMKEE